MKRTCQYGNEPIAIVGSACRFPGDATTPAKLWELLKEPRDVLREIPVERFNVDQFYHPDNNHHGTSNVRHSYILTEDHRVFDAQFFGTKPIEAISIDPQQRLLLETVYEGLESAGIPMERLQGSDTGVYVGLMTNDYADLLGRDIQNFPTYFASGTARSILSNRVSYFFDWHGPSMTIDTACSSSLVALHQAVLSLRSGECRVAVAAGTNLLLGPEQYVAESKLKMLSPSGRSRMWDKDADGYARGDGIAAVVVKSLSAALADGDRIECIVRETGINQDGRTKGITMPNPVAQADLIRSTYEKAGLDLSKTSDRPQYFEAHGTGTPAGDPVEAEAISTAFFGPHSGYSRDIESGPRLFVGSIKTVIGHTEGTAGLAAVMKASLALQNATIPPNLLLNELSPSVVPFYNDLEIVSKAQKWPEIPTGGGESRRASVNSFGFGGANAHVILESFNDDAVLAASTTSAKFTPLIPFNFSANSSKSLFASLNAYSFYLTTNKNVDLRNLAWTLNSRRTTLPFRFSIAAANQEELINRLDRIVKEQPGLLPSPQSLNLLPRPRILGIFTGQGAQWARMGAELLDSCPLTVECITNLDISLQSLCKADRPNWSLRKEIEKDNACSRINEAIFSQSICTAVQIILVDLIHAAGIQFDTVVGHSSGEIAAAYAAGYLSASDAIRIAYYRGWSLQYAESYNKIHGKMMVAGTSFEDAMELCDMPSLKGRLCVAASNSSNSTTLSGDIDAIEEAMDIFEDESKFNRVLKVDKAYHSHHMLSCAAPYVEKIRNLKLTIRGQRGSQAQTKWISSVYSQDIADVEDSLADEYWSNNMVKPVLYSQAMRLALGVRGPFSMAIEIGPHPALKMPTLQTIQEVSGQEMPYSGTLIRGDSGTEAFASMLGSVWLALGSGMIDYQRFDKESTPESRAPRILKNLPTYQWDHDRAYWHESRTSVQFRGGKGNFHTLLGTKCPDGTAKEIRWRNYLHPREMPWLADHQIQGQMVFPAAGYVSAAAELIVDQYGLDFIQMIDFQDFEVGQALTFEADSGIEVIYSFTIIESQETELKATFNCYSDSNRGSSGSVLHASAQVLVAFGNTSYNLPPPGRSNTDSFLGVEEKRFYDSVAEIGYGYTGPFAALSGLRRRMDEATGTIAVPNTPHSGQAFLIHPATLDGAIQSIMLAYSFPGDGRLRTLYLPTKIDRIRVDPAACRAAAIPGSSLPFFSSVADGIFAELSGDVEIYSMSNQTTIIQLEGLHTTPLVPLSSATDVPMFTEMTWGPEIPSLCDLVTAPELDKEQVKMTLDLERVAFFYLRQLSVLSESRDIATEHRPFLSYANSCVSRVASCEQSFARPEWVNDTIDDISRALEGNYTDNVDWQLLEAIGKNSASIVRGETNILDIVSESRMVERFFANTIGIQFFGQEMGRIAAQISNRFPHINILGLSASTGETTKSVLSAIGGAFSSYTYTDATDGSFNEAQQKHAQYQTRMAFKVLDIDKDVGDQGYSGRKYDMVIASPSLSSGSDIEATLLNVRRLMKPGGYLLLLEPTNPDSMRLSLILGFLPGWFQEWNDGRTLSPCLSVERWGYHMRRTGFSGIDASSAHPNPSQVPFSLMLTQAVDDRIQFLREPLRNSEQPFPSQLLSIIGGLSAHTASLIKDIRSIAGQYFDEVKLYDGLSALEPGCLPVMGTVLSLTELDEPAFASMTSEKLAGFQELFKQGKNIIWVGQGAQGANPFANMFAGIQRTLVTEMDHLQVQFLDVDSLEDAGCMTITSILLRLMAADHWSQAIQDEEILWYMEPELFIRNGRSFIPRLKLSDERNLRYNSSMRLVTKNLDPAEAIISIVPSETDYKVSECALDSPNFANEAEIHVTGALLRAIKIGRDSNMFLLAGTKLDEDVYVVALSGQLKSRMRLPLSCMRKCGRSEKDATECMLKIYMCLLAQSALSKVATGKALAVLDPDFAILAALQHYAKKMAINLVLLTSTQPSSPPPWIYIHPCSRRRSLVTKLPADIEYLFYAGLEECIPPVILEGLPKGCKVETEVSLTERFPDQLSYTRGTFDNIDLILSESWAAVNEHDIPFNMKRAPICDIRSLCEDGFHRTTGSQAILSLNSSTLLSQVFPASKMVTFSKSKTYWLVGLTGGLGISLCQWMARQGARYIALSSRKPILDKLWLDVMASQGCTIRAFSTDITNRESVQSSYHHIMATMPPIGGVAQGAMVLEDTMFFDLDLRRFENVLRPKVQGTILLDELFGDDVLDFMILFSSMASITGNAGQVAYNAANMFMAGLAAQRRGRGLATHAINIGAIVGTGYVTRELNFDQQSYLYRTGHNWMSEQDFHEVFAEGVLSCVQGRNHSDPCSGLRIDDDDSKKWYLNPIFQHLVSKSPAIVSGDNSVKTGMTLKARLSNSSSSSEVMSILKGTSYFALAFFPNRPSRRCRISSNVYTDAFTVKLQSALQLDPSKSIIEMSPDELGVDSLVAVDIRSWFLRELSLDIPVLKIFNAASLRELIEFAISILPDSAIPNLNGEAPRQSELTIDIVNTVSKGRAVTAPGENAEGLEEKIYGNDKKFHIQYPESVDNASEISSTSFLTLGSGDSSSGSDQNANDLSSSSSVEEDGFTVLRPEPASTTSTGKREIQKIVPMSMAQAGFWFLNNFVEQKTAFNVTPTFQLTGRLRVDDLAKAVREVCQHHEALRTFFFIEKDQVPMQGVWDRSKIILERTDIAHEREAQIAAREMADHVFNLADGETMRIKVLSSNSSRHWLMFGFHHIIMDGLSFEIFWNDLKTAYNGITLPPVVQYPDYAVQQRQRYETGGYDIESKYWQDQFPEIPEPIPLLPFSLKSERPETVGFSSHMAEMKLENSLSNAIDDCCRRFRVTPFHFHLATWQIFLLRHLNIGKICIGLGDGNRTHPHVAHTVGLFLNTLPIQFSFEASRSFGECLKHTKDISQKAFANSQMPFDAILTKLKAPRSASHNPLFQAFFNFRPKIEMKREFGDCIAQGSLMSLGNTPYDLQLDVGNLGQGDILICLFVQKDLYNMNHAELLLRGYERLLREFCQNPATQISWPKIYSEYDIENGLKIGKGLELKGPSSPTVVHCLDTMMVKYPQRLAVVQPRGPGLTYAEFKDRINVLAHQLLKYGVYANARVAVLLSPSVDWVCSLFAILRVGATYIPLDKKLGFDKLASMVSDVRPVAVITDSTTSADFPRLKSDVQTIDISDVSQCSGVPSANMARPEQSAVIMYTSGSTGTPKGMSISHSSYIQHVQSFCATWNIKEATETILQQSSYAWDMSLCQIFMTACSGGTLVVADSLARGDPVAISQIIASSGVTATFATPTEYLTWIRAGSRNLQDSSLKLAVSGGEFIPASLVRELRLVNKQGLRLINAYGPAETTFSCSSAEIGYMQSDSPIEEVQLGLHTLPNYSVIVVNHDLTPVPPGIPGEVLIGGLGVAQGYLNRHMTKASFLEDQHASSFFRARNWTVVYRTGDRGMLTEQDGLVLLGRISADNQIKLGGIRINIEEIEREILEASEGAVSQVVVSPRNIANEPHPDEPNIILVAFVVINSVDGCSTSYLEGLIRSLPLPSFMHPAAIFPVDSLPQNASGKVDRLAIKKFPLSTNVTGPITKEDMVLPFENSLHQLWKEVIPEQILSLYSIRSETDFFHVGGSSLSLVSLQSLIRQHLGIAVPLHHLFESSTLQGMAKFLQKLSSETSVTSIDWKSEIQDLVTAVSSQGYPAIPDRLNLSMGPWKPEVVVLTGATGFIGREILKQLLACNKIKTVHCIAVRRPSEKLPLIFHDPRVQVHHGDLGSPLLGLSATDAAIVSESANLVIHNGADVSFMKTYQSLKLTNVASTVELIKLTLPRRIPFHFVSSAGVTRLASKETFEEVSVAPYPPSGSFEDGYTAMKWVNEIFLESISHQYSLPVCIHRPSSVSGEGASDLDLMRNIIEYCQKTKTIPDINAWSGNLDIVSVEYVAAQIMEAVLTPVESEHDGLNNGYIRYVHECGEVQLAPSEVKSFMESRTGEKFTELPLNGWIQNAEKAGMSTLVGLYLRQTPNEQVLLPRLIKSSTATIY